MSDIQNSPAQPSSAPASTEAQAPSTPAPTRQSKVDAGTTRYAVYDDIYLRFLPGTYASKADAKAAAKDAKVAKHTIREV